MEEFGKSAGNRYLCQLGSIKNPEYKKGDALGRGLLNGPNGMLDPFMLEQLFHSSLIDIFEEDERAQPERWDQLGYWERIEVIRNAVSLACRIVGLPPISIVPKWMMNDVASSNAAEFVAGAWRIRMGRSVFMNQEDRDKERREAESTVEMTTDPVQRAKEAEDVKKKFKKRPWSREEIVGGVAHECQHAIQEFISLCLLAGYGYQGDDLSSNPITQSPNAKPFVGTAAAWDVAKRHPTTNLYARGLHSSYERQTTLGTD